MVKQAKPRKPRAKSPAPETPKPAPRAVVPTWYTPKLLVSVYQWCKQHPEGLIEIGEYGGRTMTTEQWFRWFGECLARKISARDPRHCDNQKTPAGRIWRKTTDEYQTELYRLRQLIGNRIVVRWVAPCLGARVKAALAHRFPCDD